MASERERDAERKRRKREAARDIKIPEPENPARRADAERDAVLWLRTYFAERFYHEFNANQLEIISAVEQAYRFGLDQAIAAPRGEGKTTIVECLTIRAIVCGFVAFPLIVAATGRDADRILGNIKSEFETNDLLAADYPEVCTPIRELEGAPQRATGQTADGERTYMKWAGDLVVFPTVAGSKASGAILMTRGLDGAIRGIRYGSQRPDAVIVDDPETRESAKSETQIRDRAETIERDIGGLSGPGRNLSRLILCTIQNRTCLASQYTDPEQKPAFSGKRQKLVEAWPARIDLWDLYIEQRQKDQKSGDKFARNAHAFYLANRAAMDAGGQAVNIHRYIGTALPDGTQQELSTLQHVHNLIADRGLDYVLTELQNDPPEDEQAEEAELTSWKVQNRLHPHGQRIVPANATALTIGVDLGKDLIHFVAIAWLDGAIGLVVDYGSFEVEHVDRTNNDLVDVAIVARLRAWWDSIQAEPYRKADGGVVSVSRLLVDSGWHRDAAYAFTRDISGFVASPSKGFGEGGYQQPAKSTAFVKLAGDLVCRRKQPGGIWLTTFDADHWKRRVHGGYMAEPGARGSLTLFTPLPERPRHHISYSKHIVAEMEKPEFTPRRGETRRWIKISRNNHLLDATVLACVGGSMQGVTLFEKRSLARAGRGSKVNRPRQRRESFATGGRGRGWSN